MAGAWTKIGTFPRSVEAVQALTETPVDADLGVLLENVECVVPVFHAPVGQTFTGIGRMRGYVWTGTMWVEATRSDIDMADAAGKADWSPGALPVDSPRGKFQLIPTDVALSGAGTTIRTEYFCTTKVGSGVPG